MISYLALAEKLMPQAIVNSYQLPAEKVMLILLVKVLIHVWELGLAVLAAFVTYNRD